MGKNQMKCDLHMHSYYSDGEESPESLVKMAKGLKCIALTDHDCVEGVSEAIEAGKKQGVEVVPAVEIRCEEFVEFLGYFIDSENAEMLKKFKQWEDRRNDRAKKIIAKLKKLGMDVEKGTKKVWKENKSGFISRKHIAEAMVRKGYAKDHREAFDKYIAYEGKAYVEVGGYPTFKEAIELIKNTGGVAVWAHPWWTREVSKEKIKKLCKEFVGYGIQGIETDSYFHKELKEINEECKELAKKYNLLETGGSDFHSKKLKTNSFAGFTCDYKVVQKLKEIADKGVMIEQGAEAKIFFKDGTVIKERIKKTYRHEQIDKVIRKSSTRREAKLLKKAGEHVPVPKVIYSCDKEMKIKIEFIEGKKLRDVVDYVSDKERKDLFKRVGKKIAKLHNEHIIHGDLTTSNLILKDKIYFIDFGLSFFSKKLEDKAVDLHLLKQALESKHHTIWKKCFDSVLQGYQKAKYYKDVKKRFEIVETRGRNKTKAGS